MSYESMKGGHMVRRKFTLLGVALALPLLVMAGSEICVTGPPTPESYTWDFKGETAQRLDETQWRAGKVRMSGFQVELGCAVKVSSNACYSK